MDLSIRRQFVVCLEEVFPGVKENPIGLLVLKIVDFYRKKFGEDFFQDKIPILFLGNVNYIVALLKKGEFVKITGNVLKEVHEGYLKVCREKGINPAGKNEFGDDITVYDFSKLKAFRATSKKISSLVVYLPKMEYKVNEEGQKATIEYLKGVQEWMERSKKSDQRLGVAVSN